MNPLTPSTPDPVRPFRYRGPEELRPVIERALREVIDPEVAMSIVDIGLVYEVDVSANEVHVVMTTTSAACPVAELIAEDIDAELGPVLPRGVAVSIEHVLVPPWCPERMSDRARAFMGWED